MKNQKIKEQVISLLKSEGIEMHEKERELESLSWCAAPSKCKAAYLELIEDDKG